jgi:hypothetical protein
MLASSYQLGLPIHVHELDPASVRCAAQDDMNLQHWSADALDAVGSPHPPLPHTITMAASAPARGAQQGVRPHGILTADKSLTLQAPQIHALFQRHVVPRMELRLQSITELGNQAIRHVRPKRRLLSIGGQCGKTGWHRSTPEGLPGSQRTAGDNTGGSEPENGAVSGVL